MWTVQRTQSQLSEGSPLLCAGLFSGRQSLCSSCTPLPDFSPAVPSSGASVPPTGKQATAQQQKFIMFMIIRWGAYFFLSLFYIIVEKTDSTDPIVVSYGTFFILLYSNWLVLLGSERSTQDFPDQSCRLLRHELLSELSTISHNCQFSSGLKFLMKGRILALQQTVIG